jgi:hypothetical protein
MKTWILIIVLALGTVLMKIIGPVSAGGRQPPAPLTRVIALVAPALISASSSLARSPLAAIWSSTLGPPGLLLAPSRCGSAYQLCSQ